MRHLTLLLVLSLPLALPAAPPRRGRKAPTPVAKPAALSVPPAAFAPGELAETGGRALAIGAPLESHQDGQAVAFPDGRVLLVGGGAKPGTEWFDPASRGFRAGPGLARVRNGLAALRLKDSSVLVLGGTEAPAPAEWLAPGAARFQALPGKALFGLSCAALELSDGRALLVDGASGKSWLWDGRELASAGSLARPRLLFRATLLSDGRAVVSGGLPAEAPAPRRTAGWPGRVAPKAEAPDPRLPAERFDPKKGRWSTLKATLVPRARHQATALPDGRVLLWGGCGADAQAVVPELELLDAATGTATQVGHLAPELGALPGLAEDGAGLLLLAERGRALLRVASPAALPGALQAPSRLPVAARLAHASLGPPPLAGGSRTLVLGAPAGGLSLERWNPLGGGGAHLGFLRPGTEALLLLADKRIVAVGAVVDLLDPKSGQLRPLGWREDLEALLKKAVKPLPLPQNAAPVAEPRSGHLLVALDRNRVAVLGGAPAQGAPDGFLGLWDLKRRTVAPAGALNTRRVFGELPGGALRAPDGSLLVWGGAKE